MCDIAANDMNPNNTTTKQGIVLMLATVLPVLLL